MKIFIRHKQFICFQCKIASLWQITESRNYGETAVFYIESADDDSDIERSDDSAA